MCLVAEKDVLVQPLRELGAGRCRGGEQHALYAEHVARGQRERPPLRREEYLRMILRLKTRTSRRWML